MASLHHDVANPALACVNPVLAANSPLNTEAASKYKDNLDKFEEEARRSVLPAESGDDDDDDDEGAAFGDM